MEKVDETDRKILHYLNENAKMPSKELARILKIHPNTLLQRIKKLEKNKVIKKYKSVINYEKTGIEMMALIFIKVRMKPDWEKTLRPLANIPQINSFLLITGTADAVITVRVKNKDDLTMVVREIQKNEVVSKTMTYLVLDHYKLPEDYNPFQ
ncbi:Lrp/AsnC family transcriptional regulator [Candidatus Micrarchaeota archaeon]|nr:Lrp/AsnC family transcriptional regulator [Candidatus Micrarchaeota archaeon]